MNELGSRHLIDLWPVLMGYHWDLTEEVHFPAHTSWAPISSGWSLTRNGAIRAARRRSERRKTVLKRQLNAEVISL